MSNPKVIIEQSVPEIRRAVRQETGIADADVTWYGAVDIAPKHCVIWIMVQTDEEKARVESDTALVERLKDVLFQNDYPPEVRPWVFVGAESQETVDRESGGNWYHHFK